MKCPNCDIPLMMTERKGIEIDFCTQCRGIWLDRGELDKIINLSTIELSATKPEAEYKTDQTEYRPAKSDPKRQYRADRYKSEDDDDDDDDQRSYRKHRRDRDDDRDRHRKHRYDRPYKKQKTLLHILFDIID